MPGGPGLLSCILQRHLLGEGSPLGDSAGLGRAINGCCALVPGDHVVIERDGEGVARRTVEDLGRFVTQARDLRDSAVGSFRTMPRLSFSTTEATTVSAMPPTSPAIVRANGDTPRSTGRLRTRAGAQLLRRTR